MFPPPIQELSPEALLFVPPPTVAPPPDAVLLSPPPIVEMVPGPVKAKRPPQGTLVAGVTARINRKVSDPEIVFYTEGGPGQNKQITLG